MHNKNGFFKTGTVLDEAPEHLNEEDLLKLANGTGRRKERMIGESGGGTE